MTRWKSAERKSRLVLVAYCATIAADRQEPGGGLRPPSSPRFRRNHNAGDRCAPSG